MFVNTPDIVNVSPHFAQTSMRMKLKSVLNLSKKWSVPERFPQHDLTTEEKVVTILKHPAQAGQRGPYP